MKKIISLMLSVVIILLMLTGCGVFRYRGEHVDLYTVAIDNIFGADGYRSNGEVHFDPVIEVIEMDNYGRVLFFYDEGYRSKFGTALVIMQKSEEGFVYYYQDICQMPRILDKSVYASEKLNYLDIFSEDQIDSLKEVNDWDKPIDIEKCTKSAISNSKNYEGTLGLEREDFDKVIETYVIKQGYKGKDSNSISRYWLHCNTDKYGREIYYVYGVGFDIKGEGISPESEHITYDFAIIFNPDKSSSEGNICEITDSKECYDAIKKLKEQCSWDKPYN